MNHLTVMPSQLLLTIDGEQMALPITLEHIAQILTPYPASDYQWEMAIMQIEDAISPFVKALTNDVQTYLMGAQELEILPHTRLETGEMIITAEVIELAFAVTAGLRYRHELPELPDTVAFASLLLFLREWVHHMAIGQLVVKTSS